MGDTIFILILIAIGAVVVVLATGLGGFGAGGKFNKKHANRMMRWRIMLQFVAVLLILALGYLRQQGG